MKQLFLFSILLLFAVSCEILEEDISGRRVAVIAPTDGAAVPAGEIRFRWQAVDGAAGYALRVVSPSFADAARLIADTLVTADTLGAARSYGCRLMLEAGNYEWMVSAFNSGYETRSETLRLTIAEEPAPEGPEQPEQGDDYSDASIGETIGSVAFNRKNSSPKFPTPRCGDGSSPPHHAADCNSPKLVQLLRRRRTASPVEISAGKYRGTFLRITLFNHSPLP